MSWAELGAVLAALAVSLVLTRVLLPRLGVPT